MESRTIKTKAEGASADSKIEMEQQIKSIEKEIKEGEETLLKFRD